MSIFAPIVTRDSQRQSEPEPEQVRPSPPPKALREQPSTAQTHIPKGAPLYNCVGNDKGRKEREPPKYRPAEKVLEQLDKEQKKQQKNQRKHKHISTLTKSIQNVLETIN